MKMIRTIRLLAALALFGATAAFAVPPPFPGFTAASEAKSGGMTMTGTVAASGSRLRYEAEAAGQKSLLIHDYTARKSWAITAAGCTEVAWPADGSFPVGMQVAWPNEEAAGEETIDGHPTKKFRITSQYGGQTYVAYLWRATDFDGLMIRYRDEKGTFESSYKNLQKAAPDPKLLEPPADCKK
jgi:hypothetical protein